MDTLYKMAAAYGLQKVASDDPLHQDRLDWTYRYENDPTIRKALDHYRQHPEAQAKYFDRDTGLPARMGVTHDPRYEDNAYYNPEDNSVNLGSMRMLGTFPHEVGHQRRSALGLDNNYYKLYADEHSTPSGHPVTLLGKAMKRVDGIFGTDFWDSHLYDRSSARDVMEAGASAMGAKMMIDEYGMRPEDAYAAATAGLTTYRVPDIVLHNLQRPEDRKSMIQYEDPFYRPVARPAYTKEEQRNALQNEYAIQRHPGRKLFMPLGRRPEGFESEGEFVIGMKPRNEQEWRIQELINHPELEQGGDAAYKFHKAIAAGVSSAMHLINNPDHTDPTGFQIPRKDWRPKHYLWNGREKTNTGYRSPYDMGAEQAELFTHSDIPGGLMHVAEQYKNSKGLKPLYWDPNDSNNLHEWFHGVRGFKRDSTLPTETSMSYYNRINQYDPEVAAMNEKAYNNWKATKK